MAARRALAAGSAGAAKFTVGPGRSDDSIAAFEMGAVRHDLSRRPGTAERQSAGLAAAADGPHGAGLPGLSQLRGLYRMEQLADLFDHGGLSRDPYRRRAALTTSLVVMAG